MAGEAVERLLQRLGQRRVRVHVARRLERREVPFLRERELGEQLRDVGADEVAAEQLEVLAVGDELDEADGLAEAAAYEEGRLVLTLRGRLLADAVVRSLIG